MAHPNKTNGQESLESMVNNAIAILQINGRWLNADELQLVYKGVFPRITEPTRWDRRLQRRGTMPKAAVAEELGPDMQETYDFLVREMNFLDVGTRPHNSYKDLSRHLWDTAYRAHIMNLPQEIRQIALTHSLLEYKARGLKEARLILNELRKGFGSYIADSVSNLTFWDGILLDHLSYQMRKSGQNGQYLHRTLSRISKVAERGNVVQTLGIVAKLATTSNKRIIPAEIVEGDTMYRETRARLHRDYIQGMYESSRAMVEGNQTYGNPLLLVKALCLIDRLRTVDEKVEVERMTREAMDFLPYLDRMVGLLQNSGLVNNPLAFVNATLKTELLMELEQRTSEVRSRRDTTFASFAELLGSRSSEAGVLYGGVAQQMGYKPAYNSPRTH